MRRMARNLLVSWWTSRPTITMCASTSRAEANRPTNAFIETFNGTFRDECLNLRWFDSIDQAGQLIEAWRRDYIESRPQMALGNLAPTEYATRTGTWDDTKGLNAAEN
jgi:putative transposase